MELFILNDVTNMKFTVMFIVLNYSTEKFAIGRHIKTKKKNIYI